MEENFCLTVGGQAGQGIKAAGVTFAKIATRLGKDVYTYTGFPSLIRGGHNFTQVSVSRTLVTGPSKKNNFWIALDQRTLDLHLDEYADGAGILYDEGKNYDLSKINPKVNLFPVPLAKFAKAVGGSELISNVVALGATIALLAGDLHILNDLIKEEFERKGGDVVNKNQQAAKLGYDFANEHFAGKKLQILTKEEKVPERVVVNGNDTVALGAIAAGLQFAAIYPMSPISNILAVLASNQQKYGYIYKQPEDEISAVNMAIGASFAGARAMTATSGGGFCLMTEGYGLAGMTETPLVIIDGMRPGPATGLPTWSGQGDLQFVLHASQGDFPRIVLAAGDAQEAFYLTMQAFNLADKYQTPVVLLIDKNICEDDQSISLPDIEDYQLDRGKITLEKQENYERYHLEDDGISTRTVPGVGNFYIGNSYEHSVLGYDSEEIEDINNQMRKRMQKLITCEKQDMPVPKLYGPENADVTLISWGSNKGSVLEAMRRLPNVNFLHLTWLNPFPSEAVKQILEKTKHAVSIECNFSGALRSLVKEKTGIEINDTLLKYDGRPVFPEEIIEKVKEIDR